MLLLLVIFIAISKWYFCPQTVPLDQTSGSRSSRSFEAYFLSRTLAQTIATTEEDTEKTLVSFGGITSMIVSGPCLGLG